MVRPLVLPVKAGTEAAEAAFGRLSAVVVAGMAGVSAAAVAAHKSVGGSTDGMALGAAKAGQAFGLLQQAVQRGMSSVSAAALQAHQQGTPALEAFGGKALSVLRTIGQLAAAHKLLTAGVIAYTSAAAAGAAELERFQAIAEKAAASNVGTTYFQAFTIGAERLGVKLKDVEQQFAALERATRDRFSTESLTGKTNKAVSRFEDAFLDVPTSQASPALDMLRNASTAEERIRAVTQGLVDLEAQNRQLLAIDIARDLGLTDIADLVERGKKSFADLYWQVRELETTGIRDGSLVSPELIARAAELRDRFSDVATRLAANVRPILDECSRLALSIGEGAAWTAEQFNKVVGVVGTVVRYLREAVDLIGRIGRSDVGSRVTASDRIEGLREEIQETQRRLDAIPAARFGPDTRAAERQTLEARIVQMRGEIDALSQAAAEEQRGRALSGLPAPPSEPADPVRRSATGASPATAPRSAASAKQETDEWATAYEKLIQNMEKSNEVLRAELQTLGLGTVEKEKAVALAKAEAEARRTGGTLTDEQRSKVLALAEAHGRLKDQIKAAEAEQKAYNDAVQFAGTLTSGFLSDLISGGRNAQEALMNLIKKLADALLMAALLGQGPLAGMLGLAPAPGSGSTVGGLFGMMAGGGPGGAGLLAGLGSGLFGGFLGPAALTGAAMPMAAGAMTYGLGMGTAALSPFMFFHEGGAIGLHGRPGLASAALLSSAPRLHGGGRLGADEVPIIGKKAEEVLTRSQRIATGRVMDFAEAVASRAWPQGGVTVANTYHFSGVTAQDRAWIRDEMDRRDQANAARIVPAVQEADRVGVDIQPYTKGM